jgi:hypothetical protein
MICAQVFAAVAALAFISVPAQALPFFITSMSGLNEVPANASPGTGFTRVNLNQAANQIQVFVTWSGLIGGNASAAHIHCCIGPGNTIGVALPYVGFPGAPSGTYSHIFDLTNPAVYTARAFSDH